MPMDWNLTIGGAQFELLGLDPVRLVLTAAALVPVDPDGSEAALPAGEED